jgi:aldehyde oxidase
LKSYIIIDIETASKVPGFVSSIALCIGAIIGVVVCETEHAAQVASSLIKIEYELLFPTILTIEDAINHKSYFGDEICLQKGDVEKCFVNAENVLEETFYIGGQEHFYMETNSCIVIPSNDDQEIILYLGTQCPTAAQELTASVLARDVGRITCHVKRVGGAFGGKESRS